MLFFLNKPNYVNYKKQELNLIQIQMNFKMQIISNGVLFERVTAYFIIALQILAYAFIYVV